MFLSCPRLVSSTTAPIMITNPALGRSEAEALGRFAHEPASEAIIDYLASVASTVVECDPSPPQDPKQRQQPRPSAFPDIAESDELPSLKQFIRSLVRRRGVTQLHLLATLVYLQRVKELSMRMTHQSVFHRILFMSLLLSIKALEDYRSPNKRWTKGMLMEFSLIQINQMETEMLDLLGWNAMTSEQELWTEMQRFLGAPPPSTLSSAGHADPGVSPGQTEGATEATKSMAKTATRRADGPQKRGLPGPGWIDSPLDTLKWRNMYAQDTWEMTCQLYKACYAAVELKDCGYRPRLRRPRNDGNFRSA